MISEVLNIDTSFRIKAYIALIMLFFFVVLFLVGYILINRLMTKVLKVRYLRQKSAIQNAINFMVVEGLSEEGFEHENTNAELEILKKYLDSSGYLSSFTIDYLLELNRSLKGQSSEILLNLYNRFNLKNFSLKKLYHKNWSQALKGIRELSEMNQKDQIPQIQSLLHHKHEQVRFEARIALMKLSKNDPLFFLSAMQDSIYQWHKIAMYNQLRKIDLDRIPSFSKYFHHTNISVVSFSVEMAAKFSQYECIPILGTLLHHEKDSIKIEVLDALKKLEAYQTNEHVVELLIETTSDKVKRACIDCLSEIGDPITIKPLMKLYMKKGRNVELAKAATKAFLEITDREDTIDQYLFDDTTKALISHCSHELIK